MFGDEAGVDLEIMYMKRISLNSLVALSVLWSAIPAAEATNSTGVSNRSNCDGTDSPSCPYSDGDHIWQHSSNGDYLPGEAFCPRVEHETGHCL